jgi:hypothetical protein
VILLHTFDRFENSHGVRINMMSKSFLQFDSPNRNVHNHDLIRFDNISLIHESNVVSKFKHYLHHSAELLVIPFILVIELSKASFNTFVEHYFSENNYYPIYGLDEFHGFWLYPYPYGWNIDMEQVYPELERKGETF